MWKPLFYQIVAKVDNQKVGTEEELNALINDVQSNIVELQYILVDMKQHACQYGASHLISFALTAYCDEKLNKVAVGLGVNYQMLQTRLFNTVNAGYIFFEYLEYLLSQPSMLIHSYWAYYYLLNHGYKGKHNSDSDFQRNLYLRQLKLHIQEKTVLLANAGAAVKMPKIKNRVISISYYWLIPSAILLATYAAISLTPYWL